MSTGTEDFDKLRKLLKLKQHELPPPGYFSRFPSLLIARLEREGNSAPAADSYTNVAWLAKLWRLLESSPMAAGVFGSAVCAVALFAIASANRVDKAPSMAFSPATGSVDGSENASLALNNDTRSEVFGRSTDAMFGSTTFGSPFAGAGSMTARIEPVSFSTAPQ